MCFAVNVMLFIYQHQVGDFGPRRYSDMHSHAAKGRYIFQHFLFHVLKLCWHFAYTQDSHNSLCIREIALDLGATATCIKMESMAGTPFSTHFLVQVLKCYCHCLYTQANHNSVLGIKKIALDQGATSTATGSTAGMFFSSCRFAGLQLLEVDS